MVNKLKLQFEFLTMIAAQQMYVKAYWNISF